jgi:hypothetical protein
MTIIAFDKKTLAADKQCNFGDGKCKTTKIHKVLHHVVGMTGKACDDYRLCRWIEKGMVIEDWPFVEEDEELMEAIVINTKTGEVRRYTTECKGYYEDLSEADFFAIGAGCNYAMMAMHLGYSAEDAVLKTNELCPTCGLGVDVIQLKKGSEMPSKSKEQAETMQAVAHNPEFATKVGIPTLVAKEFEAADKRKAKKKVDKKKK